MSEIKKKICSHWVEQPNHQKFAYEKGINPIITGDIQTGIKFVQNGSNMIILDFSRIIKSVFCLQNVCQRLGSALFKQASSYVVKRDLLTQDLSDQ